LGEHLDAIINSSAGRSLSSPQNDSPPNRRAKMLG
jgi:hypothetical protein